MQINGIFLDEKLQKNIVKMFFAFENLAFSNYLAKTALAFSLAQRKSL